jgi:hypothetical protein
MRSQATNILVEEEENRTERSPEEPVIVSIKPDAPT